MVLESESRANLQAALEYIRMGWAPIPVARGSKRPTIRAWQELRITADDAPRYWPSEENIGVLLGEPSNGLIDIDLDCVEAVRLAPIFLPPTPMTFGRRSKPDSHWIYRCPAIKKTVQFKLKGMLLEVRSNGGQTLFPPSVHPSGEKITWSHELTEPAEINADELLQAATRLAVACVIRRHWPGVIGSRNDYAGHVCGALLRAGWSVEEVAKAVRAMADDAGDEEAETRARRAEDTANKIDAGQEVTGLPSLIEAIGEEDGKALAKWLGAKRKKGDQTGDGGPTVIDRLVGIINECELWCSETGEAYATIRRNGHCENLRINGTPFKEWLGWRLYTDAKIATSDGTLKSAVINASARARFAGVEHTACLRVGQKSGMIYHDLGDHLWRAVEIDAVGWRMIDEPPLRFRRANGKALPEPVHGAADLRRFINVESDDDEVLVWGALVSFFSGGPYVILNFTGEQGSAKTFAMKVVRAILDPCMAPGRGLPKDEDNLVVSAFNNAVVTGDNVSYIDFDMADALCRLATGGGITKRQLYTDAEEFTIDAMRMIVLNGINISSERQDLLDRIAEIRVKPIGELEREFEQDLWNEFHRALPSILAQLYDAVSMALRRLPEVKAKLRELRRSPDVDVKKAAVPRMADATLFAEAAGPAFGWTEGRFIEVFNDRTRSVMANAAQGDPVSYVIADWMSKPGRQFVGKAGVSAGDKIPH